MGRAMQPLKEIDPRGLIADAYAIEGIGEPECRSIFLDWAIGVPQGKDAAGLIPVLLAHFAEKDPDHPMSRVLAEGLGKSASPVRRGGRRGRAV
ncbi:MAG: hypothetical protein QNJ13_13010 [Paracoccaceae bacterium]|nr:hypothetical protein [Paracoccaceae bacterium]